MRPLSLSVAGLHSYREAVTVDFESLGQYGLFGIFGTIGSGKSTLLDAITLALYGLVDRVATRSRKGLVNLAGDRCEVRFRFAVDARGGTETYEVQRAYRAEDGVAQRVASRLVQVRPGTRIVLAEKETEVNEAVAEVVGLGAEDFMRAVALPQGRFLQLLHLKGQERRQMLQRIFRLQAYGEDLRRRIRDRQGAARNRLAAVRGELAGLGDASPAAVRRAATEADAASDARERADLALAAARATHDAAERARAHRERLSLARADLDRHLADRAGNEAVEERLRAAERIRPLVAPGWRWQTLRARALERRAMAEAREVEVEAAAAHEAEAEAGLARARARRRDEEPALRTRIARLEEACALEPERVALRGQAEALGRDAAEAEAALGRAKALAQGARDLARAAEAERRRLKKELARVRVPPDERERTGRARRAADAVQAARRWLYEVRDDEGAAQGALALADVEVATAAGAEAVARAARDQAAREVAIAPRGLDADARAGLEAALADAERAEALRLDRRAEAEAALAAVDRSAEARALAEAELAKADRERRAARQVLRGADKALRSAEDALAAARHRAAAALLAAELAPGSPCAVCGSPHHPSPASAPGELPEAAVEAHRAGREKALVRNEQAVARHAGALAGLEAARAAEAGAIARRDAALAALAEVGDGSDDPGALRSRLEADRAGSEARQRAAATLSAADLALERVAAPLAAARARRDAAAGEAARLGSVHEARAAEAGSAWEAFDRERGTLTVLDVGPAAAALDLRDRRAAEIEHALEAAEATHAEAARAADEHRAEAARLDAALGRAKERSGECAARAEALGARVAAVAGDVTPAEALGATRRALEALLDEVEAAEARVAAARTAREEAGRTHADADAEARASAGACEAVRAELAAAAAAVGVPLGEVAERIATVPDDAELARWREAASAWRERTVALEARWQALREQDDGTRAPDDDAWAALVLRRQGAEVDAGAARDQAAAAVRLLQDLEQRAGRFAELEGAAARLDREVQRLDELSQLARGDRIVEYVANDHLVELTARASAHLADLTSGRYALALDEELAFVVHDEDMGGLLRPVHTLSGGESFLCALSLALALSTQVQERSARPLGFFFLDEGFGTLDPDALDRVMSAIERLRDGSRLIGLISHVPAVRERVPRYLWVDKDGRGSHVELREA